MVENYKDRYSKVNIITELRTIKYIQMVMLTSLHNVCYYLEAREKAMRELLPEDKKEKIRHTIRYQDEIQFDRFSLPARYYNATIKKYGVEPVAYATVQLDDYLRKTGKSYSETSLRHLFRNYCKVFIGKTKTKDNLADSIQNTLSIDYRMIDNEALARQYIEGTPWYQRSIDEGCSYLRKRFNIDEDE